MTSISPIIVFETALTSLVYASWHAAVLGLLVYFASWALQERLEARWHYCLWLLVLTRLALPVVPLAPWSLFGVVHWPFPGPLTDGTFIAKPIALSDNRVAADHNGATHEAATIVSIQTVTSSKPPREEGSETVWTTGSWLALAWFGGLLMLLVRQSWFYLRLNRQRRSWCDVSDPSVRDVFYGCREELSVVRPVRLLIAPEEFGPATFGVFRACVVIPRSLVGLLHPDEMRLVLLHELTHVRRWDVLLDRIAALLVAIHWFNPVAWMALGYLRRERELACDSAVLQYLGGHESRHYGHALLKVTQHVLGPASQPGAVGVIGKDHSLVRRIQMIAKYSKPTAGGKMLGGLMLLALAAFGMTDVAESSPQGTAEQTTPVPDTKERQEKKSGGESFEELCALPKGELLKRIAVPFPLSRMEYFRKVCPEQAKHTPNGVPVSMSFRWNDGKLSYPKMLIDPSADSTAQGVKLEYVLGWVTGFYRQDIEVDKALVEENVTGDFITQAITPREKVLPRLEEILRKECGLPIRLVLREVERQVFVARGRFKLEPIAGYDKKIQIYGKQLVPNSGAGGGTGTFDQFLQHTGSWVGCRVVSEADGLPKEIGWGNHTRSPFTEEMRKEDTDRELVFQHISEQTGLIFKTENRKVRVLFVERTQEQPK